MTDGLSSKSNIDKFEEIIARMTEYKPICVIHIVIRSVCKTSPKNNSNKLKFKQLKKH